MSVVDRIVETENWNFETLLAIILNWYWLIRQGGHQNIVTNYIIASPFKSKEMSSVK